MSPASAQYSTAIAGPSRRQRAISMALVTVLHVLLLLLLLRIASPVLPERPGRAGGNLTIVTLKEASQDTTHAAKAQKRQSSKAEEVKQPPRKRPSLVDELAAARVSRIWAQVISLSPEELASVDKAMTTPHPEQQSADAGDSDSQFALQTDSSDGPGRGPHGETLYNARWYREPTNAELDTYLPESQRRSGWGMIACRTAAQYRVEDCFEIGQSVGSGLAGAVRKAAWQFRVFPPRIGGRQLVGEWVRIRIDYTITEAKNGPGDDSEATP